jgi:hypothetical protein
MTCLSSVDTVLNCSYYQNVGTVQEAFFHQDSLLVSSQNVVASINTNTSAIGITKMLFDDHKSGGEF